MHFFPMGGNNGSTNASTSIVQGPTAITSQLKLRTLGNTSLTFKLNLNTSGTHPRVTLDCMEDEIRLS